MKIQSTRDKLLNFAALLWDGHYPDLHKTESGLQMYREIRQIIMLYFKRK